MLDVAEHMWSMLWRYMMDLVKDIIVDIVESVRSCEGYLLDMAEEIW